MKRILGYFSVLLLLSAIITATTPSTMNYQGFLSDTNGDPVTDGTYVLTFTIYDAPTLGNSKWTETQSINIASGSFNVVLGVLEPLDDTVFSGDQRYLGIRVGADPEVSPRILFNTLPYSFRTSTIDGANGGKLLSGIVIKSDGTPSIGNIITVLDANNDISMSIKIDETGNSKLSFYDPIDSKSGYQLSKLKMSINHNGIILFGATPFDTVFNIAPNGDITSDGLLQIGSSTGGLWSVILGNNNTADGDSATVGGGANNAASGRISTISGGNLNSISALSQASYVGAGQFNVISGTSTFSTITGGGNNEISLLSDGSFIGGGIFNKVTQDFAVVSGGGYNEANGQASVVAGGGASSILAASDKNVASGYASAVLGGQRNLATGWHSAIPGGYDNEAFAESFAIGREAKATHTNSFVWSDGLWPTFSVANFSFVARASGGVTFYTDTIGSGVNLSAGGSAWQSLSDSTMKRNIREVNYKLVLEKLAEMPISQWSYKSQTDSIEHIGPMAQDFYRLFGVGENDTHISTLDPDGVALAAIKALIEKNEKLEDDVLELKCLVEKLIEMGKKESNN